MTDIRQRRFRFGLRTFLLVVTCLCASFGYLASLVARQRSAVIALNSLGASCRYDDEGKFLPRYESSGAGATIRWVLVRPPEKSWLRQAIGDDWFAEVVAVTFTGDAITNAHLQDAAPHLKALPAATRLELRSTSIDDDGLISLHSLTKLQELNLFETPIRIDDPGLVRLREANPRIRIGY